MRPPDPSPEGLTAERPGWSEGAPTSSPPEKSYRPKNKTLLSEDSPRSGCAQYLEVCPQDPSASTHAVPIWVNYSFLFHVAISIDFCKLDLSN